MRKTISFSATLGINQGYGHGNKMSWLKRLLMPWSESAMKIVAREWQKAAAEVHTESGVYVGAVIKDSKTVYHTDWGCPAGGEATAEISGTCNPAYTVLEAYKAAVLSCLEKCAKALGQSTTQVVFTEGDIAYLDFRKEEPK